MYLYRAVDKAGRTVGSYLSRTRDRAAAQIFFRQALKRHGSRVASRWTALSQATVLPGGMGMRGEFNFLGLNPVRIRSSKYLNNMVEQDHQRIKSRIAAMLRFKSFQNAKESVGWH